MELLSGSVIHFSESYTGRNAMNSKWVLASFGALPLLSSIAIGQVIYEAPVIREFVDHPYNPRLSPDAVARLASLQEPAGQQWAVDKIYFNSATGERVWPVERYRGEHEEKFGDRML